MFCNTVAIGDLLIPSLYIVIDAGTLYISLGSSVGRAMD